MKEMLFLLSLISIGVCSIQFVSHPVVRTVVAPGGSGFLECNATGLPSIISLSWFKAPNTFLTNGTKYVIYINGSLEVTAVASSDAGEYYCVATNAHGSVRSLDGQLQLAVIESLATTFSIITFNENTPLILNCTLPTSTPSASVTWYRGPSPVTLGNRIAVSLSHQLVFSYTTSSDHAATFRCVFFNPFIPGSERDSVQYLLKSSSGSPGPNPLISLVNDALPVSQTVTTGMIIQMQCFATGRPTPTYLWSKDETSLTTTQGITFTLSNRILTITNVTLADAGNYKCTVTQSDSLITRTAILTVLDPPHIVKVFDPVIQFASLSITISCSANATYPIRWIWRNNTQQIQQSSGVQFIEAGPLSNLTIDSLSVYSNGTLQCIAYNNNGSSAANNDLTVQTKAPSFTVKPLDTLVFTGDTLALPCTALSYPYPVFLWLKNDITLAVTSRHSLVTTVFNGTLIVSPAEKSDNGNYKCTVQSIGGEVIASEPALVRVIDTPNSLTEPNDQIVPEGQDVSLLCSVASITDVTITYIWSKDGQTINNSSNSKVVPHSNGTLTIRDFQSDSNAGRYQCLVVLNAVGTNAPSLNYEIGSAFLSTVPPTIPTPPHSLNPISIEYNISRITWSAPVDNGSLSILQYILQVTSIPVCPNSSSVNMTLQTSAVPAFTIGPLKPFFRYTVVVYAVNSKGRSNASDPLEFQTKETNPSLPPSSVSVHENENVGEVLVRWVPPLCEGRNGIITNYTVTYWLPNQPPSSVNLPNRTNITLTNLQPLAYYNIQVAASTSIDRGPLSEVVIARTSLASPPNPPNGIAAEVVNCTGAIVLWNTSLTRHSEPSNNLTIPFLYEIAITSSLSSVLYTTGDTFYNLTGLQEGLTYIINVSAINTFGQSRVVTVTLTLPNCSIEQPTETTTPPTPTVDLRVAFYQQSWFLYAASGGGGGLLLVLLILLCCTFCVCWMCKRNQSTKIISPSTSPRKRLHFTYPNRRSTVLDRMMQVEAMPPTISTARPSEYAEPNAIAVENGMSTLSSQSSTLRSKYQYKSPMEQEEENLQRQQQINEPSCAGMPEIITAHREPSRVSTAQHKLFQPKGSYHIRNHSLTARTGSTSPTDTVSSFEYESHSQIAAKMLRNGYQSSKGINYDQTDQGYVTSQVLRKATTGHPPPTRKKPSTFKRLPDLALMTALPSTGCSPTPSDHLSSHGIGGPHPSHITVGNSTNPHSSHTKMSHPNPPLVHTMANHNLAHTKMGYSNPILYNEEVVKEEEEEHYQTPRSYRYTTSTLPTSTQMSLV